MSLNKKSQFIALFDKISFHLFLTLNLTQVEKSHITKTKSPIINTFLCLEQKQY